jgi:hypothetical protein
MSASNGPHDIPGFTERSGVIEFVSSLMSILFSKSAHDRLGSREAERVIAVLSN